jgi:hypothetical protein
MAAPGHGVQSRHILKEVQMARPRKNAARTASNGGDNEVANRSYAASSVIKRGTVDTIRSKYGAEPGEKREPCLCGCGQFPSSDRSVFMPGHDSRVRHLGKQVLEGNMKESQLSKPARDYLHEGGML